MGQSIAGDVTLAKTGTTLRRVCVSGQHQGPLVRVYKGLLYPPGGNVFHTVEFDFDFSNFWKK